jgi:hypothetical protein
LLAVKPVGTGRPSLLGELASLGGGGGIAPELGRADGLAIFVEDDGAVLLAGDANTPDGARVELGADLGGDRGHGVEPGLWMLFEMTPGQARDDVVARAGACEDPLCGGVDDQGLAALSADIEAEIKARHDQRAPSRCSKSSWSKRS